MKFSDKLRSHRLFSHRSFSLRSFSLRLFRYFLIVGAIGGILGSQVGCSLIEKSMKKSSRKGSLEDTSAAREHNTTTLTQREPPETTDSAEMKEQITLLEKRLDSRKEREQYSKILPWFKNHSEQMEFLKLPNLEKRNQWILKNKIYNRPSSPSAEMKTLIGNQDIALGMPADFVIKSWGEPTARDISGNPLNRNERWKYIKTLATSDGYRQEKRFVYFENGKVIGWETE